MNVSHQRQISSRTGFVLLILAVVLPVVLSYLMADRGLFGVPLLVVPLILMAVWSDLGFLLGGLFFWGTLLFLTWGTVEEGQVDNSLPGLAAVLGGGIYVLFYGSVLLLMKSSDRYKAKWLRTSSPQSPDEVHSST